MARYLLGRFPNRGIIVHGESIGGMVACHVARKLSDDTGNNLRGVICDKSFSSLTALSRRMLGNWAGTSLSLLGQWDTDSLENYCEINNENCDEELGLDVRPKPFKLIMQDPDDEIIHHTSSMKVGVAAKYLMGDDAHTPKMHLDSQYVIADALGHPVPSVAEVTGEVYHSSLLSSDGDGTSGTSMVCTDRAEWEKRLLLLLSNPHLPLFVFSEHSVVSGSTGINSDLVSVKHERISVAFIQHFAACVMSMGRRAAVAATINKKKNDALNEGTIAEDTTGFGLSAASVQLDSDDRADTSSGEESDDENEQGDIEANAEGSDHAPGCKVSFEWY